MGFPARLVSWAAADGQGRPGSQVRRRPRRYDAARAARAREGARAHDGILPQGSVCMSVH